MTHEYCVALAAVSGVAVGFVFGLFLGREDR
jgi:hypothetical protein